MCTYECIHIYTRVRVFDFIFYLLVSRDTGSALEPGFRSLQGRMEDYRLPMQQISPLRDTDLLNEKDNGRHRLAPVSSQELPERC